MSRYSINGTFVEKNDPFFEHELATAYQSKQRPLCVCRQPPVEMYIARSIERTHIIKRMPNSGHLHHPDCDSYEIPPELSGRGAVEFRAISEDHDTGLTNLKLDFSLSKLSINRTINGGETTSPTTIKSDPSKLTIRAFLHFLYEEAGLNKWSPGMEGKRSWYVVRKHLMNAAQSKVARKTPLTDTLLIPEVFRLEHKDEIVARRRAQLTRLQKTGNKQPVGILIGELKVIESARFGYKIIIKHMPETPVFLGKDVYKRLNKTFPVELSIFNEHEEMHLIVVCTFTVSASGSPQAETLSLMMVDQHWLPFESIEELELITELCIRKKRFIKGLRYNLPMEKVIASVLVTEHDQDPAAVYLVPAGAKEAFYAELDSVIKGSTLPSRVIDNNPESKELGD